jgi:hypothetical protein
MSQSLKTNDVADILASIRGDLSEANGAFETGGDREWPIQGGYVRTRILLEAVGLPEALKTVQQIEASATTIGERPRSIRTSENHTWSGQQNCTNI